MSRIRTIKPEWLTDERIAAASDAARLLSVALILLADDHGRGRANPNRLAADVWGYCEDEGLSRKSAASLRELETLGFVRVYQVRGQSYYEIANWRKHQRIDNAGKPRVPPPDTDPEGAERAHETAAASPADHGPSEPRGESPRTSASLGVSPPDPDPDLDPDLYHEPAAPEPGSRFQAHTADTRSPMERARSALTTGYQRRYEKAANDTWMGADANRREIANAAAWVAHKPDEIDSRAADLLDGVFANEWMRENRWPWKAIAKDPGKYAASARKVRPESPSPQAAELARLDRAIDLAEQRGDRDEVDRLRAELRSFVARPRRVA